MKKLMSMVAFATICTLSGMLSTFHKYQSLGNHFIILDWLEYDYCDVETLLASSQWQPTIKKLCCQKTGVGADSVLVILNNDNKFTMRIFNRDGSEAENCLNGARCAASYLLNQKNIPAPLDLYINQAAYRFTVTDNLIVTENIAARSSGIIALDIGDSIIEGVVSDVGNPHFIIFSPTTHETLKKIGPLLEHHPAFPNRTNIEWIWPDEHQPNTFHMLIHERGVGPTDACSSGVAAALWVLYQQNKISKEKKISIIMPGGTIAGFIQSDEKITLKASSCHIFSGTINQEYFNQIQLLLQL